MNATRWMSLSEFCKHLGREGIAKVEEDERIPGTWFVTWIDNSPAALSRQDALKKMERAKLDDESRQRRFLDEQIRKAKEEAGGDESPEDIEEKRELKRDEQAAPIKIGFAAKLKAPEDPEVKNGDSDKSESDKSQAPLTLGNGGGFKLGLKTASAAQPAKPLGFNAFKAASKASSASNSSSSNSASTAPSNGPQRMTAAERIMMEETERKRRREERGGHAEREQVAPKRMRL
jgi:DNA/RNA-binding protein KIN17